MKVVDVRVGYLYKEKNEEEVFRATAIFENGVIFDEKFSTHRAENIEPATNQGAYLETDDYGHISLRLKSKVGEFTCDFDTEEECGYDAAYIGFIPSFDKSSVIDIASLKLSSEERKDLQIDVWGDPYSETPSCWFEIKEEDLKKALDYNPDEK